MSTRLPPAQRIPSRQTPPNSPPKQTGNLSPGSGTAVIARRRRGRARSITDAESPNGKPMVRSSSAGKAAILRVAAAEAAAEAAEAAAVAVAATGPSPSSGIVTAGAAIALEDGGVVGDGEW